MAETADTKKEEKKISRKEQAMNTRMHILKVTMELFREKGAESVKISDICEAAGISCGAFYHHFKSKENIIQSGYKSIDDYLEERAKTLTSGSCTQRLLDFFTLSNDAMEKMGWLFISNAYRYILQTHDKYTISQERFPYRYICSILSEGQKSGEFRSDFDAAAFTSYLMTLVRGLTFDWCVCEGSYSLTDKALRTVRLVIREIEG